MIFYSFSEKAGIELPEYGKYATGILFLDKKTHVESEAAFEKIAIECNLRVSNYYFKCFKN